MTGADVIWLNDAVRSYDELFDLQSHADLATARAHANSWCTDHRFGRLRLAQQFTQRWHKTCDSGHW